MLTMSRFSANEAYHPQTGDTLATVFGRQADKSRGAILTRGENYALNLELFGSPSA
jgi:hypothetical protein